MRYLVLLLLLLGSVVWGDDKSIKIEDIPYRQIAEKLPENWYVHLIRNTHTVSGWDKKSKSNGVLIRICRVPYSKKLSKVGRGGGYAVNIPAFNFYIFPKDFVGEHVNNSDIFKEGKVIKSTSNLGKAVQDELMEHLTESEKWYFFHNNPKYKDWESPIEDIFNIINSIRGLESKYESRFLMKHVYEMDE